jgi:hypothetical protein
VQFGDRSVLIVSPIRAWPRRPVDECCEHDYDGAGNYEVFPAKPEGPLFGDHALNSSALKPAHHFFPLRPRMATAMMTSTTRTPAETTTNRVFMHSIVGRDVGERNGMPSLITAAAAAFE